MRPYYHTMRITLEAQDESGLLFFTTTVHISVCVYCYLALPQLMYTTVMALKENVSNDKPTKRVIE